MPRPSDHAQDRLKAVEILLLWEGWVSRGRLLELFAVHGTVASNSLTEFRRRFPDACQPELGNQGYIATPAIRPTLTNGQFSEYERLIGARGAIELSPGVALASTNVAPSLLDYRLVSRLHMAIARGGAISIEYRSMRNPAKHQRVIRPHALIQAGPRWHVRAYCAKSGAYRDFNLGRISKVMASQDVDLPGPDGDADWRTMAKIELVPHIDLTPDQALMVRQEYMGGSALLAFTVRVSMAKYVIQSYRAAIDPTREPVPEHLLMVLAPQNLAPGVIWAD